MTASRSLPARRPVRLSAARRGPVANTGFHGRVYGVVRTIPRGRVATYGQVAARLGVARGARAVGWALRALSDDEAGRVPWHRVVSHTGAISLRAGPGPLVQRRLLRAEGVRFLGDRVDLKRHGLLA